MSAPEERVRFSRPSMGDEEAAAASSVISSGWIVGGPRLAEFERQFALRTGTRNAVGVSSWTTGAFLVLKALGIGPGDEVIVPSLTFIASVNVIQHAGATPVFADIDLRTLNLDPDLLEGLVTPRTRAIIPVDQLGLPCEIDRVREVCDRHGLLLVHDAACSFGSRFRSGPIGSHSPVTVFSLHARKVISTGEGGMIVTDDDELAARLRRLRHQGMSVNDFQRHGQSPTTFETYDEVGYNFRLTDIQAAIGLAQLEKLDGFISRRTAIAERYIAGLGNCPFISVPRPPAHVVSNWQSFQVHVAEGARLSRNEMMERLFERGVETRRGVMASHLEAPYRQIAASLPHTEDSARRGLQLPMHPGMTDAEVERVISEVLALA